MSANQEKADKLYDAAVAEHAHAYEAAKLLPEPARQTALVEADRVWDLQREYQRKVRHGESK